MYYVQVTSLVDIIATPDVIPTDDISQPERTVTSVVVEWKEPEYYKAPITTYTLNLCEKASDNCLTVDGYPMNITAHSNTNESRVRYGLFLVIVDVVICSYLHRYNISGLRPFSSSYSLSISATNNIDSANFSSPVPVILVNTSKIVSSVSLCQ